MANPLLPILERIHRVPWLVTVPVVTVGAIALAAAANYFTADLFHETCLNERNPLTGQFEPSNCGEGAKVARALDGDAESPTPRSDANGDAPKPTPTNAPANPASSPPLATPASSPSPAAPSAPGGTPSPQTTPAKTPTSPPPTSTPEGGVLAVGTFRDGEPGHDGSGTVELQRLRDGSLNLLLKGFSVTNGPDLQVVLSRSADGDYGDGDLVIQKLKANNGTQNYAIPDGTDPSAYRTVIIWCRPFDVTFAYAILEVQ
jgi:hypothetical protein